MRTAIALVAVCLLIGGSADAATIETKITWVEGKPQVEVSIDAEAPADMKELNLPLELFDAQNKRLSTMTVKVPVTAEHPWRASAVLDKIIEPNKQHRVTLTLSEPTLSIDYGAELYFAAESPIVQYFGLCHEGQFPKRKVYFTLGMNAFRGRDLREIPVALTVRDGDDNVVSNREAGVKPTETATWHQLDVTPDTSSAVGPFSVNASIESDAYSVFFNTSLRFAQPNALVPVSSFEHGDPSMWFAAEGQPQRYKTLEMYYSDHLRDLVPRDYPIIAYDTAQKHSGRQSLRIDYQRGREAYIWSRQELPGKALALSLWVKGNDSKDKLVVSFEDHINFTLPAWQRNANFEQATLCELNFSGWRRFSVPALGRGLQVPGTKGSTTDIDGPIKILALQIQPEPMPKGEKPGDPRTIWIDGLAVESQLPQADLLSLEMQTSQADGELTADGTLAVTVGNGHSVDLKKGKLTLLARDAENKTASTTTVDLVVPTEGYASIELPLKDLAARKPPGPIELDVTFVDPSRPGARINGRATLKSPRQGGLLYDFEEHVAYSGYQPGKVVGPHGKIVDGGAEGSARSLALQVVPMQEDNSVIFHPALPGEVDRVEMQVFGSGQPVTLQPWFIDSGTTGIWLRNYNLFWPKPIAVDWQGWRKVAIPAPPIPAYHGEKNRYFLYKPWYPLNLAINVKLASGEQSAEIRIDNVRVVTHLPAKDELRMEVEYPDDTRIHPPGAPLKVVLSNFGSGDASLKVQYELWNYQGFVARQGAMNQSLSAGARSRATLVDKLAPGIYDLTVRGAGPETHKACIMVLDSKNYFGEQPLAMMSDPLHLRRTLGLTTEKVYLDWDNSEPAPYLFHYNWFEQDVKKRRDVPVLPKELEAVATKAAAATLAVPEADKAWKAAIAQATTAAAQEKQAETKATNSLKALDQPRVAALAAQMKKDQALAKSDAAAKDAEAMQLVAAEAAKAADSAEGAAKTAQEQAKVAEKNAADAEKIAKTAEDAVKPADAAVMAAEKEFQTLDAAAEKEETSAATAETVAKTAADAAKTAEPKPAEKDGQAKDQDAKDKEAAEKKLAELKKAAQAARTKADDAKKVATAARTKADDSAKKLATAKMKADELRKVAVAKRQESDALKTKAMTLRKDADALPPKAKTARDAATKANMSAMNAVKQANQLKGELAKADQELQAAAKRVADLEKTLTTDQQAHTEKVKATKDAIAAIHAAEKNLQKARAQAVAATKKFDQAKAPYGLHVQPVVGFSADWAGPESAEAIQRGVYQRWIPNLLQTPQRPQDWSLFVRAIQREYKGRFDEWVFWENPDLDEAPQGLTPAKYVELLQIFHRWVKLYNPKSKVIAGGFNFDKVLEYLTRIPEPHKLPFDEIAVQMNLGELSPEHADVEGFLDDLNDLLKLRETNRAVNITELDWGIGEYLSPMQQAANHARAAMILDSRGASPHQFSLINTGFEFDGYGVFYRVAYGNTAELQTYLPYYIPKPSYFAMIEARRFLQHWKFVASVNLSGKSLADNRAFIYRNAAGDLTAAVWRSVDGSRQYKLPTTWNGAEARDAFGFAVDLSQGLSCTPLPVRVTLPAGYKLEQLQNDLRTMPAVDGSYPLILDLHLAEPDSTSRAKYQATGMTRQVVHAGMIPGGRKSREPHLEGLESESFSFTLPAAGDVLLRRRWHFESPGQKLSLQLNEGSPQPWTLSDGQGNDPGPRESTYVLRHCRAGENRVEVRYEKPGNCAGYRLEPLATDFVPLDRWGPINTRQTRGGIVYHTSAVGTPLAIGKTAYETGVGAHATSFIEYPLDGTFQKFEVTVGVDGSTEGRGSVIFRVFVDGKPRADSGLVNGFSKPLTLTVDKLEGAQRMILSVMDAGDGNKHDLANWVDGKLYLKGEK